MSVESKFGAVTRDVVGATVDAINFNLVKVLKQEMGLNDDQVRRVTMIVKSTAESTSLNGVSQYVAVYKELQTEAEMTKKGKLFG